MQWQAPSRCPARAWVLDRVTRYLGETWLREQGAGLRFVVHLTSTAAQGVSAEVTVVSPHGQRTRTLSDRDCVLVADAVAFIMAQAIEPDVQPADAPLTDEELARATRGHDGPNAEAAHTPDTNSTHAAPGDPGTGPRTRDSSSAPDAPASQPPARETSEDDADMSPVPAPSPPLEVTWAAGLQLRLVSRPLPSLRPALGAQAALLAGTSLRFEVGLEYSPPQAAGLATDPAAEATFDYVGGFLHACALAAGFTNAVGACAGFELGLVRGHAGEFSAGQDDTALYGAVVAGPLLVRPLSERFAVRIQIAPVIPVVWPRFSVSQGDRMQELHRARAVGFLGSVGLEANFD